MKKFIFPIFAVLALFTSCMDKIELESLESGFYLSLDVASPSTRATENGADDLNENYVSTVNYYICGSADETASVLYSGSVAVGENVTAKTLPVSIPEDTFNTIFPNMGSRTLFVFANASGVAPQNPVTVGDLTSAAISLQNGGAVQNSFVMFGSAQIARESMTSRIARTSVKVKRSLAKVRLRLKVQSFVDFTEEGQLIPGGGGGSEGGGEEGWNDESIIPNSIRYTADMNNVHVSLKNIASKGNVVGEKVADEALFDFASRKYPVVHQEDQQFICADSTPYYSCPRGWNLGDTNEPYFMIMIPWTSTKYDAHGEEDPSFEKTTVNTYYKVIFKNTSFACNSLYDLIVNLEGLGSLVESKPVTAKACSLFVLDWKDADLYGVVDVPDTEAEFIDARVIDIPQDEVSLYNVNTANFLYYTSHACRIKSVKLTLTDYSSEVPVTTTTTLSNYSGLVSIVEDLEEGTGHIRFSHHLDNYISSSTFDYREYLYTIEIEHADASMYNDVLVIHQYPAIYVSAFANRESLSSNATTWVNGKNNTGSDRKSVDFGTLRGGSSSSGNSNNNMYVLTVTQLNDYYLSGTSTHVIVADPRKMTVDNLGLTTSGTRAVNAASVQGVTRQIANYYPADGENNNVVAPKIRVASSHGTTLDLSKSNAAKRCATYQEDGYPAGRWRLPTRAEIEYISTLSAKGVIPRLFGSGSSTTAYWCAYGTVTVDTSNNKISYSSSESGDAYARCVYDEWYWENSEYSRVAANTYTWGDISRENFK